MSIKEALIEPKMRTKVATNTNLTNQGILHMPDILASNKVNMNASHDGFPPKRRKQHYG